MIERLREAAVVIEQTDHSTLPAKKQEKYTNLNENVWLETLWFRANGRMHQKLTSSGEACLYFDEDGYKLSVYWATNGTISCWGSPADFDINKKLWYMNGSYLEVYSYFPSGRVQFKDCYYNVGGTWTWTWAAVYKDAGGDPPSQPFGTWWYNTTDRSVTGAPEFHPPLPDKPQRDDPEGGIVREYDEDGILVKIIFPDGTIYTYYADTGYLQSITRTEPDPNGMIYSYYMNEEDIWGIGHGRTEADVLEEPDPSGYKAVRYVYDGDTLNVIDQIFYDDADHSDPRVPVLMTYYASGRVESKTYLSPDGEDYLYYHYIDEDWNGQDLGRADRKVRNEADADGAIAYDLEYAGDNTVLSFDGVDDYINCGDDPSLDLTSALTIEAWVKTDHWDKQVIAFRADPCYGGGPGWDGGYFFSLGQPNDLGKLSFISGYSCGWQSGQKVINDGIWHHVAVTVSGTQYALYVDGELDGMGTCNEIKSIDQEFWIGYQYHDLGNFKFKGDIGDVRVYDRALDAGEISDCYIGNDITSGLVSHWDFEEGSGTVVADKWGTNHGMINGGGSGWSDTSYVTVRRLYGEADYDDPSNPLFSNYLGEYMYYATGLIKTKEILTERNPDGDDTPDDPDDLAHELYGKHVRYSYYNENTGADRGRVYKIENLTDEEYYDITYADPLDPMNHLRSEMMKYKYIEEINGTPFYTYLEVAYYTYYDSGNLESMEISENVYLSIPPWLTYTYYDEDFYGNGQGRLYKLTYNPASPHGTTIKTYEEYWDGTDVVKKMTYRPTPYADHWDVFGYYSSGYLEYQYTHQDAVNENYNYKHYMNEGFYTDGNAPDDSDADYGRIDREIGYAKDIFGTQAYEYEYHSGADVVSVKRSYKTYYWPNPNNPPTFSNLYVTEEYHESGLLKSRQISGEKDYVALNFDGLGDHVYVDDSADLSGFSGLTLTVLVKPKEVKRQIIASKWSDDGKEWILGLNEDGRVFFGTDGLEDASYMRYTTDAWQRIIVMWDGSDRATIYMDDGDNIWSSSAHPIGSGPLDDTDAPLVIGAQGDLADGFIGEMRDLQIYNQAFLSGTNYTRIMNGQLATEGRVSRYLFNEGKNYILTDSWGDNDGDIIGAAWDPADLNGRVVKYYYLDEDSGKGYGRMSRLDNISSNLSYNYSYYHPEDPADFAVKSMVKTYTSNGYWLESVRFYEHSGQPHKKLDYTGAAWIYHDTDGDKIETQWWANGVIAHWATPGDYDIDKKDWYLSGYLQDYTYYASGRVQYVDYYYNNAGTWTWFRAYAYQDAGGNPPSNPFGYYIGTVTQAETGAPDTFTLPEKPVRADLESLILEKEHMVDEITDSLLSEDMEQFFEDLGEMKNASTGEGITVAILDSGIDTDRLDVDILGGYDLTGSAIGYNDALGHGTETASIVTETASDARLLAVKVFDDEGETTSGIISNAIRYAVDMGAKILSMPFSLFPMSIQLESAIEYAVEKGAVLIAAAGNEGTEILDKSLAANENIITVGAVDNNGKLSAWSNYGSELDLLAPWDIVTLEDTEENEAGTSYSAALVAGITALMLSENPDMTADDVLKQLRELAAGFDDTSGEQRATNDGIKGVDVDEVVSMQEALRQNQSEFTGMSPQEQGMVNPLKQ